ncbi:efflux RND transporter permease subunit [Vibrio sp. TH_r3]|uniref:efflux RND transporter permease subunit n=1 Tax=Vibrio sp. TH_r3 TaxID=3082084 RepID=UPI002955D3BF|nr:efflux RND transporter permease subunit [Vibrio sp. TH_r3]MDV7105971.1 efflux RND transporter permease subunit [Vibrio sp. TH_r3]
MQNSNSNPSEGIIGWFARNSVAANLLLIATIVMGVFSLNEIRKEAFPSLAPDKVTIAVTYDSGDPEQAEKGIAIKIEEALESLAGIDTITSTSNASGSYVVVEKTNDYQLDTLFTDIKTKVDAINDFPSDAEKPVIEKATRQDHAIWVQLYGDADRSTFQDLAQNLKTDLLTQPAIRDLEIKATADPMISVELDEAKLQAYGLTLSDVSDAINAESSSSVTTSLRNDEKVVRLKVSQQAYQQQEFSSIRLLTLSDGSNIYLGDIANVQETFSDDTYTLSRYNQQSGMAIEIVMDEYGDITKIVDQANQVVDKWNSANYLPENVQLTTWYDSSTIIKDRLTLLVENALSGIALVFIILAIFLNLRVAFWVAAGLPFVFFGTLYFMTDNFAGLTINEMTTFGFIMALGIVVDDAVVVGESIYTTRREEGDSVKSTIRGTLKVAVPTIFGVLTTVAAFVAISNVEGHLGEIYAQFGTVVMICLLLSVVESKLILPSHLAHLNTHRGNKKGIWSKVQHGADAGLQWFSNRIYRRAIRIALEYRYAVLVLFLSLFVLVVGMPMTGKVRVSFFPDISGDTVRGEISMYDDASFGQTEAGLLQLESSVIAADANLIAQYGQAESEILNLQVIAESDDSGTVTVELDSDSVYDPNELLTEWKKLAGNPEGVKKLSIEAKKSMGDTFKVELKAWDTETVFAAGAAMKAKLESIAGVSGIDDNMSPGEPQYRFELTEQGRSLGIDTSSLSSQILRSFGGSTVQKFQRDSDEVKVKVRYPEEQRQTLADIMEARIRTEDGTAVPLSTVAKVYTEYQQSEVTRIDNLRAVYITASVDKQVVASNELVQQLKADLVPSLLDQYSGLSIDFAGEAEHQAETTNSMSSMFVIALIAIYALLAIPLRSYVQPVLIMMAIPFGIVGAILGHVFNDLTISILSLNGVLALSGVVVNDSLLLVSRFNTLVREKNMQVKDAIYEACTGRLRAVLLTSFTTFAGLAPLLGETSVQAQFLIPAAAALGYGIMFATLITLVLIPSLLLINHEISTICGKLVNKISPSKEVINEC